MPSSVRPAAARLRQCLQIIALAFSLAALCILPARASTLEDVRKRGHLLCGVSENAPGFASVHESGQWAGLEIDFCKAVAAATLGKPDTVRFVALAPSRRYTALAQGEVDLVARATSWSMSRDVDLGLTYTGTLFHDGIALLVPRGFAVASVLEMSGSTICAVSKTNTIETLNAFFKPRQMPFRVIPTERWAEAVKAYADGRCTMLAGDLSVLAAERGRLVEPAKHMILPEIISKNPSGAIVRANDINWRAIVAWTRNALIAAEEFDVSSTNAPALRESSEFPDVRRLLGREGNLGEMLRLSPDWSYQAIVAVGNYGEMFARNIGKDSALGVRRGLNDLWNKGGLMFAYPLR